MCGLERTAFKIYSHTFYWTSKYRLVGDSNFFLWILIVTNSINLIDGLDGLAAGVSIIVLSTIVYLSMPGLSFVVQIALITIFATLGFLVFNFYPAKIFMGDTGALFLGFVISLLSLLEFKNVTVFSLLIPALILGVPLSDTFFAIVRRIMNKNQFLWQINPICIIVF